MKSKINAVFGRILKETRKNKSLTQQEVADFTGLDRAFISDLERGKRHPSLDTFFKLAWELKIKPADLIAKIDNELK